jgi:hypothetical protein
VDKDIGLGVITVAPIIILIYLIMFGALEGVLAIILYNINKFLKRTLPPNPHNRVV